MMNVPFVAIDYSSKTSFYRELKLELEGLLEGLWYTDLSNFSALLNQNLPDLNWVGFYLWDGTELRLGPFQGRTACLRIPMGRGVCGTAAQRQETVIVPDVEQFPGHIACDARSRSEIVLPLVHQGRLLGVLDIDSPSLNRFDSEDTHGLQTLISPLVQRTRWPAKFE